MLIVQRFMIGFDSRLLHSKILILCVFQNVKIERYSKRYSNKNYTGKENPVQVLQKINRPRIGLFFCEKIPDSISSPVKLNYFSVLISSRYLLIISSNMSETERFSLIACIFISSRSSESIVVVNFCFAISAPPYVYNTIYTY